MENQDGRFFSVVPPRRPPLPLFDIMPRSTPQSSWSGSSGRRAFSSCRAIILAWTAFFGSVLVSLATTCSLDWTGLGSCLSWSEDPESWVGYSPPWRGDFHHGLLGIRRRWRLCAGSKIPGLARDRASNCPAEVCQQQSHRFIGLVDHLFNSRRSRQGLGTAIPRLTDWDFHKREQEIGTGDDQQAETGRHKKAEEAPRSLWPSTSSHIGDGFPDSWRLGRDNSQNLLNMDSVIGFELLPRRLLLGSRESVKLVSKLRPFFRAGHRGSDVPPTEPAIAHRVLDKLGAVRTMTHYASNSR